MKRLRPHFTVDQQIDIALRNMILRMQLGLERADFDSLEDLEAVAQHRERYLRISKDYKAPPAPENSLLPDLAFREAPQKIAP